MEGTDICECHRLKSLVRAQRQMSDKKVRKPMSKARSEVDVLLVLTAGNRATKI